MNNIMIRRTIRKYVKKFGSQYTSTIIDHFSKGFRTTKQRISGNLSCMAYIDGTITINKNRPHSIMY